jgi:hypothetical protein
MQPFGGQHDGYEFGTSAKATVSTLADRGADWHHFAVSWNRTEGTATHFIDGQVVSHASVTTPGQAFLDSHDAYLVVGMNCYADQFFDSETFVDCNENHRVRGTRSSTHRTAATLAFQSAHPICAGHRSMLAVALMHAAAQRRA